MTANDRFQKSLQTLKIGANAAIVLIGAWIVMQQLTSVLRPLLLAILVAYVLMPYYDRLHKKMPAPAALALLGGGTFAVLLAIAGVVANDVIDLSNRSNELQSKAQAIVHKLTESVEHMNGGDKSKVAEYEKLATEHVQSLAVMIAKGVAVSLPEIFATCLYLLFLLLESGKFPNRVRAAYPKERADQILHVFGRINSAIISFLKAKVKSSLFLAIPVAVVLLIMKVPFPFLWAMLTFVCNFIPYLGSVIACGCPILFAFLMGDSWQSPAITTALLLTIHILSASVIEPMLIGKAVGLSPLVILMALSIWGLLWGIPGMFLAVPLTVVVKIIMDNVELTKSMSGLLNGE